MRRLYAGLRVVCRWLEGEPVAYLSPDEHRIADSLPTREAAVLLEAKAVFPGSTISDELSGADQGAEQQEALWQA